MINHIKILIYCIINWFTYILQITLLNDILYGLNQSSNINITYKFVKILFVILFNKLSSNKLLKSIQLYVMTRFKQCYNTDLNNMVNDVNIWKKNLISSKIIYYILNYVINIVTYFIYFHFTCFNHNINLFNGLFNSLYIYIALFYSLTPIYLNNKCKLLKKLINDKIKENILNIEHIFLNNTQIFESNCILKYYEKIINNNNNEKLLKSFYKIIIVTYSIYINNYMFTNNFDLLNILKTNIYVYYIYALKNIIYKIEKYIYNNNIHNKNVQNKECTIIKNGECSENNIIELDSVNYSYDKKNIIINNKTINIGKNKVHILFGENGCGKTTIIKLILGLLKCNEGIIKINGSIVYIPNIPIIYNNTVEYNVLYGCIDYDIYYWCNFLGLTEWYLNNKDKIVGYMGNLLTKGDRKKIQLLNSLLKNTEIIIFDEPSTELDTMALKWFGDMINKLNKLNKTIIIASHDKRLFNLCDNINVINL